MSETSLHNAKLKRCGITFLLIGLFDIGLLAYCIRHEIRFNSSLSVIGIFGGLSLLRGNLRAAAFMQWISVLLSTLLINWLLILPWLLPTSLVTLTVRLHPWAVAISLGLVLALVGGLLWTARELGSESVAHARAAIGRTPIRVIIPRLIGAFLPLIASGLFVALQSSSVGQRALTEGRRDLGPEYRFLLSGIRIFWNAENATYHGNVMAWNDSEILQIPVTWEEAR